MLSHAPSSFHSVHEVGLHSQQIEQYRAKQLAQLLELSQRYAQNQGQDPFFGHSAPRSDYPFSGNRTKFAPNYAQASINHHHALEMKKSVEIKNAMNESSFLNRPISLTGRESRPAGKRMPIVPSFASRNDLHGALSILSIPETTVSKPKILLGYNPIQIDNKPQPIPPVRPMDAILSNLDAIFCLLNSNTMPSYFSAPPHALLSLK